MIPEALMETLQRLKAMTEEGAGCTAGEAENAAARLKAILDKHQLSIADVTNKELGEEVIRTEERRVGEYMRIPTHIQAYAASIAAAYSCKLIVGGGRDGNFKMSFVGLKSDATVVSFFFETTMQPVLAEARKQGKANGWSGHELKQYVEAFLPGVGAAIYKRLRPETSGVAALVPLKKEKVEEWCKEELGRVKSKPLATRRNSGTTDGYAYGSQMPLQRGIDTNNTNARALA